ncbi:MAG TPA: hypothetical protein DD811_08995 [Syntrophomonas sp.]|jgi:hypothetical protein|nr:hypothetical protein [Syntrophomonas sp.]
MLNIGQLAQTGLLKKYGTDEIIFHQGDPGHEMFILLKGRVRLLAHSTDGTDIPFMDVNAGDFFGEMSLLENAPRSATVQALDDCMVIVINETNFESIIAQQPALALRIMKGMSKRIRQINEELAQLKGEINSEEGSEPEHKVDTPATSSIQNISDLVPEGHGSYPDIAPPSDAEYLFEKEIDCPVCGQKFTTTMVRSSKLKLKGVDSDLRQTFEGFNSLWYMVWVCPHCFYANFNFEFKKVDPNMRQWVTSQTERMKATGFKYSQPRRLDEVFTAFYLALNCLQNNKPDASRIAKIWLRLSWLYADAHDEAMYKYASQKALEYFSEAYYNTHRNTSVEQDQRLTLLLAELNLRTDHPEEALKHYRNSIVRKGGSAILNRQAEDKIQELKELLH